MVLRRITQGVVALVVAAATVVSAPTASQAADVWTTLGNGKDSDDGPVFMAIRGGVNAGAGADALVWTDNYALPTPGDQLWKIQATGYQNQVWIRNATPNQFALSIKGNGHTNGTGVIQWWFDSTNLWQRWTRTNMGGEYIRYTNVGAKYYHGVDMCIGVENGGAFRLKRGAKLILWNCGNGEDQQWHDDTW